MAKAGIAHLCELANDAMALPAPVTDEGLYGILAEDEVLMRADLHTNVCCRQDVDPPRPRKVLCDHHTLCTILIVHLRRVPGNLEMLTGMT